MSNSIGDRLAPSPSTGYFRRDPSPAESATPTNEANSKFDITLQGLDDGLLTMTARLRPGAHTRSVERAIRRYMGSEIQEGDTVRIYRDGETLEPDDRVGNNSQQLQYRVFPATPAEPSKQAAATPKSAQVAEIPRETRPFPAFSLEAPTTVAQVRKALARASGIADPNTIVVYLVGGPRAGPLEGNDWQLRQAVKWQHRDIVVTERPCPSYIILHGCGREYLCQTSRQDGDGVSVGALKQWLKDTLIRRVHPTLDTQISVDPGDISLYVDNRPLFNDAVVVRWATQVAFRLSPDVEAAFTEEEKWLCPSFECALCHETVPDEGLNVSAVCTHEEAACTSCIRQWVSTCLNDDGWDKARCPLCSHPLDYNEIKAHTSEEDFERYEMLATKAALGDIPNFHWCLEKGCGAGQIHEPARGDRACPDALFVCHSCKGRQCTRHAVKWHEGRTCDEYDRGSSPRLRQAKASELAIRGVSKRCPGCSRSISKFVGCNHITCVCGKEWCYLCQAVWTQSETTNIPFCKHRPECPERNTNNNPFFARPRPDGPPEYPDLDGPDDGGRGGWIEAYRPVVWPQAAPRIIRQQPHIPPRNEYPFPVHHPAPPMFQHPENQGHGYPSIWAPNPRFGFPHFAEHQGFLTGPPQPLPGPLPAVPRPVGPRHDMRPNWLYAPRADYGGLAPPHPGPPPNNPRAAMERRRRPFVNYRLPSEFYDREPAEWGQRLPGDVGELNLAQAENQRPYNGGRYAAGAPGVRRPQVKIPAERGMLARMRSS